MEELELLSDVVVVGAGNAALTAALAIKLGLPPEALIRTVTAYNAAVQDGPCNPASKDGKRTQGIAPAKTNWALRLDAPPFVAYSVCCGITLHSARSCAHIP